MKFLICSLPLSLLFLIVGGEKGTCTNGVEETVWRQAVDEKLEDLKVLLEKHTARTDELSCCCQNDTSTTAPTTSPNTTTATTTSRTTPTAVSSPITTTKTAATEDCELGWTGSGGSCYKRMNGSEQNCLETCRGHGGELADINSRKENEFIMSLMDKDGLAYIGGGNYANWGPGGGPPEGPCALLEVHNDGIWWRTDCSRFNSCICEVM
eukprot:GFUD01023252.1.p1 GENE.GFUD01023252.1~~GFUD01023252.1.p1  ORF type:complete len:210 (+),score=36.80 GFUD01023252.1:64-693(+)